MKYWRLFLIVSLITTCTFSYSQSDYESEPTEETTVIDEPTEMPAEMPAEIPVEESSSECDPMVEDCSG